jgi:hypothetical protein
MDPIKSLSGGNHFSQSIMPPTPDSSNGAMPMSIDSDLSLMSIDSTRCSMMSIDLSLMSVDSVSNNSLSSSISSTDSVQQGIPPLGDMALHVSNIMDKGWFPSMTIHDRVMTLATWLRGENIDSDFLNFLYTDFVNNGPLSQSFNTMEIIWSALPVHF